MKVRRQTPAQVQTRPAAAPAASRSCRQHRFSQAGFSLLEIMVVLVLIALLVVAGLNTVTLLDRSSRRQALHTSALEQAQGKLEELQSSAYNPPTSPFLATTNTQKTNVTLALNKASTNTLVGGTMTTVIAPVAQGHLVTVSVATTNAGQVLNVQLQTLLNEKSGSQP